MRELLGMGSRRLGTWRLLWPPLDVDLAILRRQPSPIADRRNAGRTQTRHGVEDHEVFGSYRGRVSREIKAARRGQGGVRRTGMIRISGIPDRAPIHGL